MEGVESLYRSRCYKVVDCSRVATGLDGFSSKHSFLTVLEAGQSWEIGCLVGALFLVCRELPSCHGFTWQKK